MRLVGLMPCVCASTAGDSAACISYMADGPMIVDGSGTHPSLTFKQIEAKYPPDKIAAIEMYRPSEAPPIVNAPRAAECATVVIWTKRYLGLDR